MSTSPALFIAQMGAVLVTRPGSPVFHVASRADVTPSGRWVRRAARTVCSARTGRLSIIPRAGVRVLLGDLRVCARCWVRLSAFARRAQQPPNNIDLRREFFAGVTSTDLVVALAVASTVDETHAIANVANLLFGPVNPTVGQRPAGGLAQGRWDFEVELLARRRDLVNAERSPEEREAAAAKRDQVAAREAQIAAQRKKDDRMNRALDRRLNDQYLMPRQRELLENTG